MVDNEDCLAYVILTKKMIHLILRKVRKTEKIKEEILKKFEFVKLKEEKLNFNNLYKVFSLLILHG